MEQSVEQLDQKIRSWISRGYDISERCLMMASPFLLGIGGAVSSLLRLPGAIEIMLLIASVDFMFLSMRSTVHLSESIHNKQFAQAVLFALIAIPTTIFVLSTLAAAAVGDKLPFDAHQLVWFHFGVVCAALVYTIALYPWYVSGRAFDLELQAY
jgi:cytochrome bd-type quinol oxidase subunit 2